MLSARDPQGAEPSATDDGVQGGNEGEEGVARWLRPLTGTMGWAGPGEIGAVSLEPRREVEAGDKIWGLRD